MEDFKNPFEQYEGDQIVSLGQNPTSHTQINKNVQQIRQKAVKQMYRDRVHANLSMNEEYENESTIFISTKDALSSKGYEEPPILEDIGVDPELIADKIISVIKCETPLHRYIQEADLFGPILIALLFGLLLMLSGKMHFGDIYAIFVLGNVLAFTLFNLMSKKDIVSLYSIMSALGYCLLPMLFVGLVGIFMQLRNSFGIALSLGLSAWCAYSASFYIEMLIKAHENDRKLLIGYPLYLYYVSFAMITIF